MRATRGGASTDTVKRNENTTPDKYKGDYFVAANSLKLPEFTGKDASTWFFAVESSFYNSRMSTELTKYHRVVQCLGVENVSRLRSFFDTDPHLKPNPYTLLKEEIIAHFEETIATRITKLLHGYTLGDLKPSEFVGQDEGNGKKHSGRHVPRDGLVVQAPRDGRCGR